MLNVYSRVLRLVFLSVLQGSEIKLNKFCILLIKETFCRETNKG